MTDLQIRTVKFIQPLSCKCGRPLSRADASVAGDRIEFICSACHATAFQIDCDLPEEDGPPWD